MQRTKLETHINFKRDLETQNALTERTVTDKVNFNQNFPKQLEVFTQNHLNRQLSYKTMDDPITEKNDHLALICLGE